MHTLPTILWYTKMKSTPRYFLGVLFSFLSVKMLGLQKRKSLFAQASSF